MRGSLGRELGRSTGRARLPWEIGEVDGFMGRHAHRTGLSPGCSDLAAVFPVGLEHVIPEKYGAGMTLDQGDLRLLESELATRLLRSTIPARYAYTALDGTPRIVASWYVWTGEELVLPTFISAPHVSHATYRVRALQANPDVAVSIDTESFPPEVLSIRGKAEITEIDGVAAEYAEAAHRFLGSEQAAGYLAEIDVPGTRMARIAVRPAWVAVLDFQTRMPSALGGVR